MNVLSRARRLVHMNGEEFLFRLECEARKTVGRARHAIAQPRWNRSSIVALLNPRDSDDMADAVAAARRADYLGAHRALGHHFQTRRSVWPVNAGVRAALAGAIRERFPTSPGDAASHADALTAGRYDLLGYRGVYCGTPPDWHRDPIHDARTADAFWASSRYLDPACGDHKIIWELNRHQHWRALGRAFWLTGNHRYRTACLAELNSWLTANPPGRGINWASMLELALRALSWTWTLELFTADTDRDNTPWLVDLLVALDRQLTHVAHNLSRYFSPNTHLTGEALGLYAVSRAFPELRHSRMHERLGRDVLLEQAKCQIGADGGHVELSAHYHRYSTDFYLLAFLVARSSGDAAARPLEDAVRAQARYLRTIAEDGGRLPLIGDEDGGQLFGFCGGRPADASPTLAAAAAALNDPALAVTPASEEASWILGHVPRISDLPPTPWPSAILRSSGYFVSRLPPAHHLVMDAGPHGFLNGGHAHSDALSIVLTVAGDPLLVDPGTATYTMDAGMRDRFRSTRMHNTVVLDGSDHATPDGPFHWHTRPDAFFVSTSIGSQVDFAQGAHRAYPRLTHVRSVLCLRGLGWMIVDHVIGAGVATAESWWHVHPMWTPAARRRDIVLRRSDAKRITMGFSSRDVGLLLGTDAGMFSPEYGRIEGASAIKVLERRSAPFAIGAFISAGSSRMPEHDEAASIMPTPAVSILPTPLEIDPPGDRVGAAFLVAMGTTEIMVLVAASPSESSGVVLPGKRWGTSAVQTDARAVALQRNGDRWETVALIDGSMVWHAQIASDVHDRASVAAATANPA